MNVILYVVFALVCLLIGLALIAGLNALMQAGEKETKAEALTEKMWNKNTARSAERMQALREARATGNYDYYNALRAAHGADFDADVKAIASIEVGVDERTAEELRLGINPYPKQAPAPRGKLVRR